MPRKGRTYDRKEIKGDLIFGNPLVEKLINRVMKNGKKSVARWIVYSVLYKIGKETGKQPLEVFSKALENIQPLWDIKARRIGGATYQIPTECSPQRKEFLGLKFLVDSARKRTDSRGMPEKLVREILDAYEGKGGAIKLKENIHKLAEANKSFAHYRW